MTFGATLDTNLLGKPLVGEEIEDETLRQYYQSFMTVNLAKMEYQTRTQGKQQFTQIAFRKKTPQQKSAALPEEDEDPTK